ncbi:hypothetical protein FB567DRAFT_107872 [Paraphoma chrysanthemicola]|uniref:Secreted protein n=1 Tax=Paraphoma chrysanthemicola TaxID=798071 RepID=A0A8K0QZI6_9PLEO|nr:hypothetical protein FB567DRAFT_107872 [Paraphoma chrysanthemicola]
MSARGRLPTVHLVLVATLLISPAACLQPYSTEPMGEGGNRRRRAEASQGGSAFSSPKSANGLRELTMAAPNRPPRSMAARKVNTVWLAAIQAAISHRETSRTVACLVSATSILEAVH